MVARFKEHDIRVVNTWLSGAKLYVDGDLKDTANKMSDVKGSRPSLSSSLTVGETRYTIEVFFKAVLTVKIKICVDGTLVGGEPF